jgi:hypothetical protein
MGAPQRLRDGIIAVGGDLIGYRGSRAVTLAAGVVETAQTVEFARHPHQEKRNRCGKRKKPENHESGGSRERRQNDPKPGPRQREEKANGGREHRECRPKLFPQQAAACALQRLREHDPGRLNPASRLFVQTVQKPLRT